MAVIIKKARKELLNAPDGRLRVGKSQGCSQYYYCEKGGPHNGVYIPNAEIKKARKLAQKAYDEKVLRYAERAHRQISKLLEVYADDKIEQIYLKEHPARQKLVFPFEDTYEMKLESWMQNGFEGKFFAIDAPEIYTNGGIRVRSKSEKILADYFELKGILYKYECPLWLNSYGLVYPDFTFLSRKTGREIYWEHEGMMDNPEYAQKAIKKIENYEKDGIYLGENLILTFETSQTVLNMEIVRELVAKYLE